MLQGCTPAWLGGPGLRTGCLPAAPPNKAPRACYPEIPYGTFFEGGFRWPILSAPFEVTISFPRSRRNFSARLLNGGESVRVGKVYTVERAPAARPGPRSRCTKCSCGAGRGAALFYRESFFILRPIQLG